MTPWKQSLHRKSSELKEGRPDEHWLRCNEATLQRSVAHCSCMSLQRCHLNYVTVQRRDYLSLTEGLRFWLGLTVCLPSTFLLSVTSIRASGTLTRG